MFEIYHAVQYNAIVWIYNRRLLTRPGAVWPAGLSYSATGRRCSASTWPPSPLQFDRYFTASSGDRMFSGEVGQRRQWLVALFVTSSILHFYYDGFIWKVSDRRTGENLVDDPLR